MIGRNDVFDSAGNLKVSNDGQEIGRELLERKAEDTSRLLGVKILIHFLIAFGHNFDQNAGVLSNEANKPVQTE